jgi:site-specific DNA recombinase
MSNSILANIVPMTPFLGTGPGMPVVLYLRKSNKTKSKSRDETISVQQQRNDLIPHCQKRGWVIVGEYVDDGKSASKNDRKRVDFARLLSDAENPTFRAVVVWDLSRLTRKNSVDAGDAAKVFKKGGILVMTYRDGEIDLNTRNGRNMWNSECEGNSELALKVSGGTIRGRDYSLQLGNWPHGQIPYGYRRQYWDGDQLKADLHRREPAGKARHWATKIVPDPKEIGYAAKVIQDFATRDVSIRGLAIEMTRLGAPTANKKPWTPGAIKDIIRCPIYLGDIAIGYSEGWKRSVRGRGYEAHAHSAKQIKEDACPAVVDRPTWKRANEKLDAQRNAYRVHTGKSSPLSGIIICGHCGKRMAKFTRKGVTRFVCSTASRTPENPTCKQWTVQEGDLLPVMIQRLIEAVDLEILERVKAKPAKVDRNQLAEFERQEVELTKKVTKAARNLALCEPDVYAEVHAVVAELKDQLESVKSTAESLRTAAATSKSILDEAKNWWAANRERLVEVIPKGGVVENQHIYEKNELGLLYSEDIRYLNGLYSEPDSFRELLKTLDAQLILHFSPKPKSDHAKKQYYSLEWGRLRACVGGHFFDGTGLANEQAPTAKPCASWFTKPARCR